MTAFSQTDVPCDCGYLNWAEKDPGQPIEFSAEMNEYRFVYPNGGVLIYHCPLCGGRTPKSFRSKLFAEIPEAEQQRLFSLVKVLKTVDEVVTALGHPDRESEPRSVKAAADLTPSPTSRGYTRVLHYSRLSEVANVDVQVSSDGTVYAVLLGGKYLQGAQ